MASGARTSLSNNRNFNRLWFGQAVSTAGDAFGFVAMPILVLQVTGSVVQMGIVTSLTCIGQVVATFFSGVAVDRLHRRRLMIACDVLRMFLYAILPVLWWLGRPSVFAIYAVAGLGSALASTFQVGYHASIPNVVDKEDVSSANGRLQATQALTYIVGSMAAGAIAAGVGAVTALAVDAASFGISALTLANLQFRQERAARDGDTHGGGAFAEFVTGVRFLFGHPVLRALAIFQVAVSLLASIGLSAAVIDLIVYRLKVDFQQPSGVVGFCLGIAAAGAVLGALVAAKLGRRLGLGATVLVGTVIQALGLVLAGFVPAVAAVTIGGLMWSGGLTTRSVVATSLRQSAPDAVLGRVTAASWALVATSSTFGALFVTRLAAAQGTGNALLTCGLVMLGICVAGMFTPLARRVAVPAKA